MRWWFLLVGLLCAAGFFPEMAASERLAPWLQGRETGRDVAAGRILPSRPQPTPFVPRPPGASADISGCAVVVDGDTVKIDGTSIRIHGIDAPERAQACCQKSGTGYGCGSQATEYMEMLVAGEVVSCVQTDTDRYGRMVAICESDGLDVGYEMVWAGWAIAYRRFSDDYVAAEQQAHDAMRGMWSGTFVDPADWRAGHRSCALPMLTPSPTFTPRPSPTLRPTPTVTPGPTMRPTPRPTPRPTVRPTPRPTARSCCRVCTTGKACGDSCISRSNNCSRPRGCACNG